MASVAIAVFGIALHPAAAEKLEFSPIHAADRRVWRVCSETAAGAILGKFIPR